MIVSQYRHIRCWGSSPNKELKWALQSCEGLKTGHPDLLFSFYRGQILAEGSGKVFMNFLSLVKHFKHLLETDLRIQAEERIPWRENHPTNLRTSLQDNISELPWNWTTNDSKPQQDSTHKIRYEPYNHNRRTPTPCWNSHMSMCAGEQLSSWLNACEADDTSCPKYCICYMRLIVRKTHICFKTWAIR